MGYKKIILFFVFSLVLMLGSVNVSAAGLIPQKAVLSGNVVSVVQVGTFVEEGTELVRVSTLAGSATAARANVGGIVKEVLVSQGSMVKSGEVIARIEAQ